MTPLVKEPLHRVSCSGCHSSPASGRFINLHCDTGIQTPCRRGCVMQQLPAPPMRKSIQTTQSEAVKRTNCNKRTSKGRINDDNDNDDDDGRRWTTTNNDEQRRRTTMDNDGQRRTTTTDGDEQQRRRRMTTTTQRQFVAASPSSSAFIG